MPAIELVNVSKAFSRNAGRLHFRGHIKRLLAGAHREKFHALKHISFRVEEGESLAIIGSNGAGKSTLLSVVAGLAEPDEGSVWVNGRVAALLELGSGFHPDLTGAENVRLNAALLGLSRKRTNELFDEIVDFSGVGEFIQEPLRTYSSGMVVRLAFSVAIGVDPEILIVDEVLAVGDQAFQTKCLEKIHKLRARGKTMLCVSHSMGMVQQFCDQAIWLDHGELIMAGSVSDVTLAYSGRCATAG
jgi:ABC-type polysaccharide/polyol phosphate transport system ATPase subunit